MEPDRLYLLENVRYEDGQLWWIKKRNRRNRFKPIGGPLGNGYLICFCLGKMQLVHRLVWIYHNGAIPKHHQIDHINGNRTDNRIQNLRLATKNANHRNRALPRNNTTGYMGIQRKPKYWYAYIVINRKQIRLGNFKNLKDAVAARKAAERLYGFDPRHGSKVPLYTHSRDRSAKGL